MMPEPEGLLAVLFHVLQLIVDAFGEDCREDVDELVSGQILVQRRYQDFVRFLKLKIEKVSKKLRYLFKVDQSRYNQRNVDFPQPEGQGGLVGFVDGFEELAVSRRILQ